MGIGPYFALGMAFLQGAGLFGIVYFAARLAIRHERNLVDRGLQ